MRTYRRRRKIWMGVLAVILGVTVLTGCTSLRKKFTRTKKNVAEGNEFIPVLQPVEYEKVVEPARQVYGNHYAMEKVYFKDLWDILGRPAGGEKREKYIIGQIMAHFDGMTALLPDNQKDKAMALRGRLELVLRGYDKPAGLRRYDLLTGDLRKIERDLYKNFKPDAVILR
ncbi:MAG: hypothetical protein WCI27_02445 [Candidatus Omnitrophota bacterium]